MSAAKINMADFLTVAQRSDLMSKIRGRGNRDTEMALAKLLRRYKITGWRRNQKIFGKPDFVFPKFKLAVFVDGCFWHGCPKHSRQPKSNRTFWRRKLSGNKKRDQLVTRQLQQTSWRVLRIWEHNLVRPEWCISRIRLKLKLPLK
jgi:DNA mismatch endonuclease, patch repair protein